MRWSLLRSRTSFAFGLAALLAPATAPGQTVYFQDDFDCSDEDRFGTPPRGAGLGRGPGG